MLGLKANTSDLEVVTSAAADIEYAVSVMVASNATPPVVQTIPDPTGASITSATTTQIVDTSGLTNGHFVNVKGINLRNNHASTSCDVTVQINRNGTVETLIKVTLLAGEALVYTQNGVWIHYDVNGGVYPSVGNAASQAEMEAGTATDKYVTPQGVNWHPGACKAWGKANGAGTSLLGNWNVSGITDTGTGRLGVTIGTDFSDTAYSVMCTLERSVTSLTATGVEDNNIRNASQAVGSFEIESYDHTATTMAAQDPASYYWACFGDQ